MDHTELVRRIHQFPQWHYQLELAGELTPIFDKRQVNRHAQRKRYFFDPLVVRFGGSLAGKRILDLGCNAGYWSLLALQHDCEYLVGIDARQMHIEQAELVLEVNGIESSRYELVRGNIFDLKLSELGDFDIVFCLGLMYHIGKPLALLEKVSRVNGDLLVVDTTLSGLPGSLLHYRRENRGDPRSGVDYDVVAYPSRRAIIDLVRLFGYSVVIPKPRFTDWEGAADYRFRKRRVFLCAKETELESFPVEAERSGALSQILDTLFLTTFLIRRRFVRDMN